VGWHVPIVLVEHVLWCDDGRGKCWQVDGGISLLSCPTVREECWLTLTFLVSSTRYAFIQYHECGYLAFKT
jgi:hypothetical protein